MSTHLSQAQSAQQGNRTIDGKYTFGTHAEPGLMLSAPQTSVDHVRAVLADKFPPAFLAREEARITSDLNISMNFSPQNMHEVANARLHETLGFTQDEYERMTAAIAKSTEPELMDSLLTKIFGEAPSSPETGFERAMRGEVVDELEVAGHGVFHRRRDGIYPVEPHAIRIQADRELSEEEIRQMHSLSAYAYRSCLRGESVSDPIQDTPYSFIIHADTTKSRSSDLGLALGRFEEDLPKTLREGSALRTTNRSGEGTQGTRAVEGFGTSLPRFELYYDDVESDG